MDFCRKNVYDCGYCKGISKGGGQYDSIFFGTDIYYR